MNDSQATDGERKRSPVKDFLLRVLKSKRWLVIPPIALGIFVVVMMIKSKKEIPTVEVPEQSVKVAVVQAALETIDVEVTGYGTARSARSWTAVAEVSGRIKLLHPTLESGVSIEANEDLLKIDEQDYRLRVQQRLADLNSAKASLAELKASQANDERSLSIEKDLLLVSENDVARTQRLRESNAVSSSELDAAQSSLLKQAQSVQRLENSLTLYPAKIESAQAKVVMAQAAVSEAERNVERTLIRSPIQGVLSNVNLESGQFVSPNQQLFEVQDVQRIEVEAQISLAQLKRLMPDKASQLEGGENSLGWLKHIRAEVSTESGGEKFRWRGKPIRLTESVDSQTRTIGLIVEVHNPSYTKAPSPSAGGSDQSPPTVGATSEESGSPVETNQTELKLGTYCEIKLMGRPQENVIAIPRTAFDGNMVYVVDSENRLRSRQVLRGESSGDRVIVTSGIQERDKVVVRPPLPAIEGMLVREQ